MDISYTVLAVICIIYVTLDKMYIEMTSSIFRLLRHQVIKEEKQQN